MPLSSILSLFSAAAFDLAIVVAALTRPLSTSSFALLVATRMVLSAIGSFSHFIAPSPRIAEAKRAFLLLASLLHFFVPVVGFLGMWLVVSFGLTGKKKEAQAPWTTFAFEDDFDVRAASVKRRAVSPTKLAEVLRTRSPLTADKRFQAVLQIRHLPLKQGIAMLKLALKDPSDEVRLFAFSRLEKYRDELETKTRELTQDIAETFGEGKALLHLRLAEAYWEIGYLALAEGAVLKHALKNAQDNATAACKLRPGSAPAEFLQGRILLHQKEYSWALNAFERATYAGYPRVKALPYMAECAFRQRRYSVVRAMLRDLDASGREALAFQSVVDFWQ